MGKRFACFTQEQQDNFDRMNQKARKYAVLRAQGLNKRQSYVGAGYADTQYASKGALVLERRYPRLQEYIDALAGHKRRENVYKKDTPESKEIDKKAEEELPMEMTMVPSEYDGVEDKIPNIQDISGEQARRIKFYRDIADGTIKTVRTTLRYDKNGDLIERKVEKTSDIQVRMKARLELDRALGVADMLNVGKIEAGSVTINIVDASKKEIPEPIDGGKAQFVEEVEEEEDDE